MHEKYENHLAMLFFKKEIQWLILSKSYISCNTFTALHKHTLYIAHPQEKWFISTKINFTREAKEIVCNFTITWDYNT